MNQYSGIQLGLEDYQPKITMLVFLTSANRAKSVIFKNDWIHCKNKFAMLANCLVTTVA